ncbi:serine hydrolase [Flavobacteriaceae bacterium Ap0902]|nr:serine hydrolase [Flavobacteriaceae bacterium Ap0902]
MNSKKSLFIKVLNYFVLLVILLIVGLYITGNQYILKGIQLTYLKGRSTAGIYDYTDFTNRKIEKGNALPWQKHKNYNQIAITDTLKNELLDFETEALVVIKDGKLWLEHYWNNRKPTAISNSFSMSKSYVTMLMFKALENGDIKSLNQPIIDFMPEFKGDKLAEKCTVGDFAAMTSGFDWKEDYYLPLNPTAKAYFADDIKEQMLSRKFIKEPGGHFEYLSGNTQLLAILIERATGKNLSHLLSQHFWKPLGMENNGLWSLDGNGKMEKAYCCVNATALDYAKIGQLLLQKGHWSGKQLIDSMHIEKMVKPNYKAFNAGEPAIYGYSIWTDYEHSPTFYALLGHLGQRTIVIPEENLVIVRLGKKKDKRILNKGILQKTGTDIYYLVDEILKMNQENAE